MSDKKIYIVQYVFAAIFNVDFTVYRPMYLRPASCSWYFVFYSNVMIGNISLFIFPPSYLFT